MRSTAGARRVPAGPVALALGGFGIGLTQVVIAAPLPEVSASLRVSDAAATSPSLSPA